MKKENKIITLTCHSEQAKRDSESHLGMLNQVQCDEYVESGRSMVEMLGVLAIIGVLSVAGIAGYTTAMRSYRTNEIVNAASMLYMMGMAQNKGEGTGTLDYSNIGTNPRGATLSYRDKTVTITIDDEDDCAMVKNKLGDKAGDCTAAATGYTLPVNFGEVKSSGPGSCAKSGTCDSTTCPWIWEDGACYSSNSLNCHNQGGENCEQITQNDALCFEEHTPAYCYFWGLGYTDTSSTAFETCVEINGWSYCSCTMEDGNDAEDCQDLSSYSEPSFLSS